MKKLLLICIAILLLPACADKQQYEQAVLANMKKDQDIKDYKIDPEDMTECIMEVSVKNMPGSFAYDTDRLTAYKNYTTMLSMSDVQDKKNMLKELRELFGSPKALADAHRNYAESVTKCLDAVVQRGEDKQQKEESKKTSTTPNKLN